MKLCGRFNSTRLETREIYLIFAKKMGFLEDKKIQI